jgi:hypothetical protein
MRIKDNKLLKIQEQFKNNDMNNGMADICLAGSAYSRLCHSIRAFYRPR